MSCPPSDPDISRDEFLLGYLKEAPEYPIKDAGDLDGKMVALFSVASIVLGLAGVGRLVDTGVAKGVVTGMLIAAAATYVAAAATALWSLRPADFERSLHANTIRAAAMDNNKTVPDIRAFLLDSIAASYVNNTNVAVAKATRLPWMIGFVGAEVAFVAASLILSRL